MTVHVAYDDRLLDWRLSPGHPSDPVRAKLAVDRLRRTGVPMEVHPLRDGTMDEMLMVHGAEYLQELLVGGRCDEWAGERPDLARTARLMFGGTMGLVDLLLERDDVTLAFSPQGAKHHAMRDYASGFCALADFAVAALRLRNAGHRVLIVDYDAHAGDGTESLLLGERDITTCSIHDSTIFPGTGWEDDWEGGAYNWPLAGYAGDTALLESLEEVIALANWDEPTALLVVAGADGHKLDPLSSLEYSLSGFREAARMLATSLPSVQKTLIGGAGGYRPFDVVPAVWADTVTVFSRAKWSVMATTAA